MNSFFKCSRREMYCVVFPNVNKNTPGGIQDWWDTVCSCYYLFISTIVLAAEMLQLQLHMYDIYHIHM